MASACSTPQAAEPPALQAVKTQVAAAAPQQPAIRYSASVEAFDQVTLAFKATGYVTDVLRRLGADGRVRAAQAGDRVTKGVVLARVRDNDYRERVSQGRARVAEGQAALTKARLDLERARTLFASDSLTKPELDAAQAATDAAEARVAGARADVELALNALRDCALVSPVGGVILERRVEVGSLAAAGTVGFVVGDVSTVKARFGIPDSAVQSIRLGEPMDVTVEAIAGTRFSGRVTAVAPAADPQSRVFDVEITIPNHDGQLRPGMIGTVAIGPDAGASPVTSAAAVAVPLTAVVRSTPGSGQFGVLVVGRENTREVARLRQVELGEVTGNAIAVTKGLREGERVVVSGANLLVDGEAVHVLP
jgi:RND family efflux transporter MFP subunit